MTFSLVRLFADLGVAADALSGLGASVQARRYDAGEFLVRQGESAPNLYYLNSGLVKMFYLTAEGKEFVKSFIAAGQLTGSLAAQMGTGESTFSIVCLEPVEAEVVPYDAVQRLVDEDVNAMRFVYMVFRDLALKKEMREHAFLCLSPEERYQAFLQDYADLAERVTQADIARYLGITPVALSRIRGRLKEKA